MIDTSLITFLGDELKKMKEQMPSDYEEYGEVYFYHNKENRGVRDVLSINDGITHGKIENDDEGMVFFDSLERMNPYTPICDWKYVDKDDMEVCVDTELAEYMDDDEKILVILLPANTGEIPEATVWEKIASGEISDEVRARLIFSVSKKAKSHRGWHIRRHDTNKCERIEAKKDEELYAHYYEMKDSLLQDIPVVEYHYDEERSVLYLYRTLCGYKYHSIFIKDIDIEQAKKIASENNIPIKLIEDNLYVNGVQGNSNKIYCDEFVEFAYEIWESRA